MMYSSSEKKVSKLVSCRNQSRCLNSQPFSRKRAYLNKQKIGSKIVLLETNQPDLLNEQPSFSNQTHNSQLLQKICSQKKENFDSMEIQNKINYVNKMIFKIQNSRGQQQQPRLGKKRAKSECRTQPDTLTSHTHEERVKKQTDRQCIYLNKQTNNCKEQSSESIRVYRSPAKKMIKVRSSKNKLKVYNPFPLPLSEFL